MSKSKAKLRKLEVEREESNDSKDEQTTSDVTSGMDWLRSELELMMYGLGDCRRPLARSVQLVEAILRQQMALLIDLAAEVRDSFGGRGEAIAPQHFLFLIRHDKLKLGRLLRHLCLKDAGGRLAAAEGGDVGPQEAMEEVGSEEVGSEGEMDGSEEESEGVDSGAGSGWESKKSWKRRQICSNFLKQIDQTGELLILLDEQQQQTDEIKLERHLRLEKLTRFMDTEHYLEFSQARTASFGRKSRLNKFGEWILGIQAHVKLNAIAMEILSYLAYETVAQLVDLALIVKNEGTMCERNPEDQMTSSSTAEKTKSRKRRRNSGTPSELCLNSAIQPSELLEAMRRFNRPNGAMAAFSKSYTMPLRTKLLCC